MKTIEEIMGLVGKLEELSGDRQVCVEEGLNPVHIERAINDATRAIEIAIHELAKNERKAGFDDAMEVMKIGSIADL